MLGTKAGVLPFFRVSRKIHTIMINFPCAKINLGLNVVSKRADGYHNIETVFYPIPLHDALEIKLMDERFPSEYPCDLKITGNGIDGNEQDNLVVKAYRLLAKDFNLPHIHIHLYKHIPSQAGLGGGSSDAAYMIRLLDSRFRLNIGNAEMEHYASLLGADCAFFISSEPAFATSKGEVLSPVNIAENNLHGYHLLVVKPDVMVSTAEAYSSICAKAPAECCRDIVGKPISYWRDHLSNDFEQSVFKKHPILSEMKEALYGLGADYAQMSGSGSALFGLFKTAPDEALVAKTFNGCSTYSMHL